jgi:hypothetical protein
MLTKHFSRAQLALMITVLPGMIVLCGCPHDQTITLVANLTKDRQTVEAYVKQIKQHFQPADPIYLESKQRYIAAFSLYEGYITAVRVSIQTGIKGDLQSLAVQAAAKSNDFVSYAADNLPQSRSLLSLLPTTLGAIASYVISIRDNLRIAAANVFYQAVQWKDWDAIT